MSNWNLNMVVVDAFTSKPFGGNPAAVCVGEEGLGEEEMQLAAREMNLSETAFVTPTGEGRFGLRWFTPVKEVSLCGHATLASAHVLWETGLLRAQQPAEFDTLSGLLSARREGARIVMDFPAVKARRSEREWEPSIESVLGCAAQEVLENELDVLVCLMNESEVRTLKPDLHMMKAIPKRGVIVTARASGGEFDFVSRYFAPAYGVEEDPVTGSAHCCLGPYWAEKLGKSELKGYQASARGGEVGVRLRGDRVDLIGEAVTMSRVEMRWVR